MRRGLAAAVTAVVAAGLLAGCGGDPVDAYCAQLQQDRARLADMVSSEAGGAALLDNVALLQELADQAPPDLTDEWQTFLNAVRNLDEALGRADVTPEDFAGGEPPAGLTPEEQQDIAAAASQLTDQEVVSAVAGIEQQARDVCKVNLGL